MVVVLFDTIFCFVFFVFFFFFFQAEDGIRDLVRARGLGDVYKRQVLDLAGVDSVDGSQAIACDDSTG